MSRERRGTTTMGRQLRVVPTSAQYATAYEKGHQRTLGFLLSKGLPPEEAAETSQAAWARGWERRHQIREVSKLVSWINTVALNLYRNRIRRDSRHEEFLDRPVAPRPNHTVIDAHRMLAACCEADRSLLSRRYLHEEDIRDIAREDGCTETAIRVRLLRARRRVRERFEDYAKATYAA